ncbi:MAG: hypothetical protein ACKO0M_09575 [Cyanobium sp.]
MEASVQPSPLRPSPLVWGLTILLAILSPIDPALAQDQGSINAEGADTPARSDDPDDLAATVELYGFLPSLDATTTVRGFEVDTHLSPQQILDQLRSTFSARASVEKGRLGLLLDVSYNQLGTELSRTTRRGLFTGKAEINAINGFYDLAARWRLGNREQAFGSPGQGWLIPYAGMRLVEASLDVQAEVRGNPNVPLIRRIRLARQGTLERTWAQPLLGLEGSVFVAPRLRLFARGDVAGFGLAGEQDFSANAQAGVGYAIGNNTDLNLSWRYRSLLYNNGAERANGYASDENGLELGLKFFF